MLFWLAQQIIISLIVIVLAHSIYTFLKNNLTTPKIRDMVKRPAQQYKEIYETMQKSKDDKTNPASMKSELQNYLKELSTVPVASSNHNVAPTGQPMGHTLGSGDNFQIL